MYLLRVGKESKCRRAGDGELMATQDKLVATQDIVLPAQPRGGAANRSAVPSRYPKLDSAGQTPIGVHLDIEEPKLAEFYLAEGQRLGDMGI